MEQNISINHRIRALNILRDKSRTFTFSGDQVQAEGSYLSVMGSLEKPSLSLLGACLLSTGSYKQTLSFGCQIAIDMSLDFPSSRSFFFLRVFTDKLKITGRALNDVLDFSFFP